jgi:hypothetical protein
MDQIVSTLTSLVGHLSQMDLLIIAGVLATWLQSVLNKYRSLRNVENWVLSFALPWVTAVVPYAQSHQSNFGSYGALVYFLAQIFYFTIQRIKANAVKSVQAAPTEAAVY